MKKSIFSLILLLVFVFTPGMTCRKNAEAKFDKNTGLVESTEKAISKTQNKIEDKGKAFVYGAKYANEQETNRTPAIDISGKFLDLATISLGNPSMQDSVLMRDITDNLLKQVNIQLEMEKQRGDLTEKELKESNKLISNYKKEIELANKKLDLFSSDVIKLQKEKELLNSKLDKNLEDLEKINKENADLAAKWQEDNSFWNKINPFNSLFDFIKKLFGWGLFLSICFIVFKVLEIFFPALNILGVIFSPIISLIKKFVPTAIKGASLVSSKVFDTLKQVVEATDEILYKLKELPIEDDIIKNYSDDYKFSKKEVKDLLLQLTEKTVEEFEKELKDKTDKQSRGIITKTKSELGIKNQDLNIEI